MIPKHKIIEWTKRYFWAEIISIILSVGVANIFYSITESIIITAFIASWGDIVGFYGVIIFQDLRKKEKKFHWKTIVKTLRNMMIEFGPTELFDSMLMRPFFLSLFPYLISNYTLAIFVGSIVANFWGYIPIILSYELRKKVLKD